ncbi:hypothetical protein [Ruminococcus sp. JE7B6]|uniref:hypothetical protein n=1 Tax=Ruminococcus sp. JE7B6 TaxID=3233380 RepID=UPI00389A3214
MADFSINIKNKYSDETFQSVKDTYDWIVESLRKLNMPQKYFDAEFHFSIGEMRCTTVGIDEFIQHAYGVSDFTFYELQISVDFYEDTDIHVFITNSIIPKDELHINSNDKVVLQNLVDIFNRTEINNNNSKPVTNQITINGGNNAIANNNSTATIVSNSKKVNVSNANNNSGAGANKESKFRKVFNAIMTNLASNFIWYLLCVLAGALIAYFITKQ